MHFQFSLQEAGADTLTKVATYLERESQGPGPSSVDSVATEMCSSIGNLLVAASDAAAVRQPNITNRTSQEQSKARSDIQGERAKVSHKEVTVTTHHKPMSRSMQLHYISVTAFS